MLTSEVKIWLSEFLLFSREIFEGRDTGFEVESGVLGAEMLAGVISEKFVVFILQIVSPFLLHPLHLLHVRVILLHLFPFMFSTVAELREGCQLLSVHLIRSQVPSLPLIRRAMRSVASLLINK